MTLDTIPISRRYSSPCDTKSSVSPVSEYLRIVAMLAQSVLDRTALPHSYNPAGVSLMPDYVNPSNVSHGIEIKILERTPMVSVVAALHPIYLHGSSPLDT